jgi:hypothetical protein
VQAVDYAADRADGMLQVTLSNGDKLVGVEKLLEPA